MKFYLLVPVCIALLQSCTDDVGIDPIDKYNIDIGSFELLEESLAMLPYYGKTKAVYVDSMGDELILTVQESPQPITPGKATLYRYNVYETGDTVRYHYRAESKAFHLRNDSLELSFSVILRAQPYYSDPTSEYVADVLNIWCSIPNTTSAQQVFYHVVNQRTWPASVSQTENIGQHTVYGKEFSNVLFIDFFSPKSIVYFNYEIGIVSFMDHDDKTWRFDRFL